jgi:tetratricopeptide (TPR) repeat protein
MESEVVQLPLSDQFWIWFHKNKKPVVWSTSVVVVVGLVVWFIVYQRDQKQLEASEALSNVASAQVNAPSSARPADAAAAYLKVAKDYPNSSAAARAVLLAAGSLYTEGKYDQAKQEFERFTHEYHGSPFMGEALLGVASCLEAQGNTKDAMAAYKQLVERFPNDALIPQAKFALGRLSEAQNQPEQAFNYFEQVAQADPYGSIGSEAGMRAEELKLKHPNLAPVPAAASQSAPFKIEKATAPVATNATAKPAPAKK